MDDRGLTGLFEQALQLVGEERSRFLESLPLEQREPLEVLLKADESAQDRGLFNNVVQPALAVEPEGEPGESFERDTNQLRLGGATQLPQRARGRIGQYRILELIGEGGMGSVFMAEQTEPITRRVALKVIRADANTQQVVARFEVERQALALMEHAHIAKIFDAGVTEDGLPYFAMELVNGIAITKYCDQARLNLEGRLQLFVQVCRAIQHAHQKGIIHRDIKPSNILVTQADGLPVPKVIDFGLAKALSSEQLPENTLFTQFGQVVGTLEYMSPEQAEMNSQDIDTRSDVYAVGGLWYELLTGSTPIGRERIRTEAFQQIMQLIRDEEPRRPSQRLSDSGDAIVGISDRRATPPTRLSAIIRGDLDWITMKALEKDRQRRYDGAAALASEVERYLKHEPIEARPPGFLYRLRKAYHRHRLAFASAVGFVFLLVAGLIGTGSMWLRARSAEADATEQANEASRQRNTAIAETAKTKRVLRQVEDERQKATLAQETMAATLARSDFRLAVTRWESGLFDEAFTYLRKVPNAHRNIEWRWLRRALEPNVLNCFGHRGTIYSLAFSPNGKYLASMASDGLRLWDAETGEVLHSIPEASGAVSFSPNGLLGFGSETITLWDVGQRRPLRELTTQGPGTGSLEFSPDGKTFLTQNARAATIWDVKTGAEIRSFPRAAYRAVFSPDGSSVAAGTFQNLQLWDAGTGVPLDVRQKTGTPQSLDFSPTGRQLGWTSAGSAYLTDVASGGLRSFKAAGPRLDRCRFSPDGRNFAGCGGRLLVWNRRTGELLGTYGDFGFGNIMAFGPDSRRIATASGSRIQIVSQSSNPGMERVQDRDQFVTCMATSADGNFLASGSDPRMKGSGNVQVRNTLNGELVSSIPLQGHFCSSMAFTPNAKLIAFTSDTRVRVHHVESGELFHEFGDTDEKKQFVAISHDGNWLAASNSAGSVTVWSLSSFEQLQTIVTKPRPKAIAFQSATNHLLVLTDTVRGWDVTSGDSVGSFDQQHIADMGGSRAGHRLVTADGKRIITLVGGKKVRISDAVTGEQLVELAHTQLLIGAALGPDDGTLRGIDFFGWTVSWPAEARNAMRIFEGHRDQIKTSGISADGLRIYSVGTRQVREAVTRKYVTVHERLVWDSSSGAVLPDAEWIEPDRTVSDDGRWQVAHSGMNVLVFDLDLWNTPAARAKRLADAKPDPVWHSQQAIIAEKESDWFAATFHRAWQLKYAPASPTAFDALRQNYEKLKASDNPLPPPIAAEALAITEPK